MADKAVFVDVTKCTGCRGCQVACKEWNQLPAEKTEFNKSYENPPRISGQTWTRVKYIEKKEGDSTRFLFRKVQCMHCAEASCMEVCPVGAFSRNEFNAVILNESKCIGCKNCAVACPFQAVNLDEEKGNSRKCWLCYDRLKENMSPACVKACPPGALDFGDREQIVAMAAKKLAKIQKNYPKATLYGVNELGGLNVIYLLDDTPEVYGLPKEPKLATANVVGKWLASAVGVGAIVVAPFLLLFKRREEGLKQKKGEVDKNVSG